MLRVLYTSLLTQGKLDVHLQEVDAAANEMMLRLPREMAKREGVTEETKHTDPLRWAGLMSNIYARAKEVINADIIYI